MAAEFAGHVGVKHVQQPEGNEWCFAAMVSAFVDGEPIDQVHQSLVSGGISEDDGSTSCPAENQHVQMDAGLTLTLELFVGLRTEVLMSTINEHLQERKPVALLHKKNADELDNRLHWLLIAGRYHNDGETQGFILMDPLQDKNRHVETSEVTDMVERTVDFFGGAWACALSIEGIA